jgi:hypothetical protein
VPARTDFGVDLCCEAVVEGPLFLHFWVQVRVIDESHVIKDGLGERAWYSFDTDHLAYWKRQPIPVYTFLVPVAVWPPDVPRRIYGIRLSERIVQYGIPQEEYLTLESVDCFSYERMDQDLRAFIAGVVACDASIIQFRKGIVGPVQKAEARNGGYPSGLLVPHLGKVLEGVRDAAVVGLLEALRAETHEPAFQDLRKRFESAVRLFENDLDDLGVSALVQAAKWDGDVDRAKTILQRAVRHAEDDPGMGVQAKQNRLSYLANLLSDLES